MCGVGLRLEVQGSGFRVQGSGLQIWDLEVVTILQQVQSVEQHWPQGPKPYATNPEQLKPSTLNPKP